MNNKIFILLNNSNNKENENITILSNNCLNKNKFNILPIAKGTDAYIYNILYNNKICILRIQKIKNKEDYIKWENSNYIQNLFNTYGITCKILKFGYCKHNNTGYQIMDKIEGTGIFNILQNNNNFNIIPYIDKIINILEIINKFGYHCDQHLNNFILNEKDHSVKIIDFSNYILKKNVLQNNNIYCKLHTIMALYDIFEIIKNFEKKNTVTSTKWINFINKTYVNKLFTINDCNIIAIASLNQYYKTKSNINYYLYLILICLIFQTKNIHCKSHIIYITIIILCIIYNVYNNICINSFYYTINLFNSELKNDNSLLNIFNTFYKIQNNKNYNKTKLKEYFKYKDNIINDYLYVKKKYY